MMTRPLSSVVSVTPGGSDGICIAEARAENVVSLINKIGREGYWEISFGQFKLLYAYRELSSALSNARPLASNDRNIVLYSDISDNYCTPRIFLGVRLPDAFLRHIFHNLELRQ
jgi:hypothetical protein